MPLYGRTMVRRRGGFRRFARRRHNWQWVRQVGNNVTATTPPAFQTSDLLADFKSQFGFSVNFPDITIWRIRLKVSIKVTFPTTGFTNPESAGALVAVYCDNTSEVVSEAGPVTHPYEHKWMVYEMIYASEQVLYSGIASSTEAEGVLYREFDIKTRRRLENLNWSLFMDVQGSGQIATVNAYSWASVILLKIGR